MNNIRFFLFTILLILLLSFYYEMPYSVLAANQKLPSGIPYTDIESNIDDYVEQHKETTVGMEAAVFDRHNVLFQKEYGYINKEEQIELKTDSVLDWGSASKTLIWVSAMQLWETEQLDLNADIRQYLPDGFLTNLRYDTPITMYDLMNHKGGFQEKYSDMYLQNYDDVLPLNEQLQKYQPPQIFEPGMVTAYSNWGSALAAYVIECITHQTYADYVKEHIFTPLGMDHTAILPDLSDKEGVLEKRLETICYTKEGIQRPVSFYHIPLYPCGMCAGTLNDFILYTQALIPDENTPCPLFKEKDTLLQLFSPTSYIGTSENARFCHGFIVYYHKNPVLGHGGNSYGCSSMMLIDPESGIGTVVMVNQYVETVYTENMMDLIYGTCDKSSNLGMPKSTKKQCIKLSRTFWKGPLTILGILETGYTLPDEINSNTLWMLSEKEDRFELADITDMVIIPVYDFIIDTSLIYLLVGIFFYIVIAGGISGLIIHPIKQFRLKKQNMTIPSNPLIRWHYISCGLIAAWMLNFIIFLYQIGIINAPSSHYQWQVALNGVIAILMTVALIWIFIHKKENKQKGIQKLLFIITGFCLLISIIIIIRWDIYEFWNI